ncbi:uncharacterized protein J3D65DRAFT_615330 [Phyllosticta citribraziliensis]|uniref:RRM domain-containing protein n=1 Tax=Phyllosticta citribraziliensis TaxID=989973 RepID=A0ABR1M7G9_9PEZI
MFALRRAAVRVLASSRLAVPTSARSFTRLSTISIPQRQKFLLPIQRRFASDDARPEDESVAPENEAPAQAADAADARDGASESADAASPSNSVYIGNLFFQTKESDILSEFSKYGKVSEVRLIRNPRGLSKGFGFVTFETNEAAVNAAQDKHQSVMDGRRISVYVQDNRPKRDAPRAPSSPTKTLFIGNLSYEMTDKDLNDLFRDIRNVLDVRVAVDRRTGMPRGFAHADFIDEVSASKARDILTGRSIHGRTLKLDFSAPSAPRPPQ